MVAGLSAVRTPFSSITMLYPQTSISLLFQRTSPDPFPAGLWKSMVGCIGGNPSQTPGPWSGFGMVGQRSQRSPNPSPSRSRWSEFEAVGQLSQASPRASPSGSDWDGFGAVGQLSQTFPTPS